MYVVQQTRYPNTNTNSAVIPVRLSRVGCEQKVNLPVMNERKQSNESAPRATQYYVFYYEKCSPAPKIQENNKVRRAVAIC